MFPPQYHHHRLFLSLSFSSSFQPLLIDIPPSFHLYTQIASAANPRLSIRINAFFLSPQCHSFFSDATLNIPDPRPLTVATLFTAKTLAESVRFYFRLRPVSLPPVPWWSIIHTYLGKVVGGGDIVRPQCQDLDISGKHDRKYPISCSILSAIVACASTIRYASYSTSSKPVWWHSSRLLSLN